MSFETAYFDDAAAQWRRPERPRPVTAPGRVAEAFNAQGEALTLLEQGIEQTLTESGYKQFLDVMARFRTRSLANNLLILAQDPDATLVANKVDWPQKFDRAVKPEELSRGIKVWYPLMHWVERVAPDTGEITRVKEPYAFRLGNVYDLRQTDGRDLPPPPVLQFREYPDENQIATEVNRRLATFLIGKEVRCESGQLDGGAMGVFRPGPPPEIVIRRPEHGPAITVQTTRTLAHEAGHFLTEDIQLYDRRAAEVIAESAGYVTMRRYGLPTDGYSFAYVAAYAQDIGVFKKHLGAIHAVANKQITAIEGERPEEAATWL